MNLQRTPFLIPLVLVIVGMIILLNNYFIIDADIIGFWPILLILLGLLVVLRGDLAANWQAHTFGITRGSVESASLEINSAEIDVRLRALKRSGRLIAGQYTVRSRPKLVVRNNHARLILRRGDTWFFSLADWDLELAQDIPWTLLMSAHLGELQADLRGMNLKQAHIATGIGNIKVICPDQEAGPLYVRSTFGDIQLAIPKDVPAVIQVKASPLSKVVAPNTLQVHEGEKYYTTPAYHPDYPALDVIVASTFGNITLAVGGQLKD